MQDSLQGPFKTLRCINAFKQVNLAYKINSSTSQRIIQVLERCLFGPWASEQNSEVIYFFGVTLDPTGNYRSYSSVQKDIVSTSSRCYSW
jgi:hypothetical protein